MHSSTDLMDRHIGRDANAGTNVNDADHYEEMTWAQYADRFPAKADTFDKGLLRDNWGEWVAKLLSESSISAKQSLPVMEALAQYEDGKIGSEEVHDAINKLVNESSDDVHDAARKLLVTWDKERKWHADDVARGLPDAA